MIDSVLYTPASTRPGTATAHGVTRSSPVHQELPALRADAPVSSNGPQSRLDRYREISQFEELPAGAELISGIDIRV